jgi:hypothetical protein
MSKIKKRSESNLQDQFVQIKEIKSLLVEELETTIDLSVGVKFRNAFNINDEI